MTTQTVHIIQAHNGTEIIDNTMFANRRLLQMEKFERRWKLEAKTKRKTFCIAENTKENNRQIELTEDKEI